ncbi:DinB family protein [Paracraurococcus sp. LOR1-02]|uniref:DinB family protein n=1 Tax=Paracraurococcus lichenis TaxID=3064888 RepID=A0ABT9E7R3_9PROT|nr:transposase [Paracraurococcus sp. LOR1-02]MDO9712247.1 DinB family protein [Paracraurococcus sp. LOR1-02]
MLHHDFADLRAARLVQDQKLVEYVHGLSEDRLAARLDYVTSSGVPQSQPLHHVLAHLFNHQTHHRRQAHHLVGLALGRDKTPVLDLLAYQRSIRRPGRGRPRLRPRAAAGDKAYSSPRACAHLRRRHIRPVIPTKKNEYRQPGFDRHSYRLRNRVERLINRLKHLRRIATHYEKRAANYLAMLPIGMILLWLKPFL